MKIICVGLVLDSPKLETIVSKITVKNDRFQSKLQDLRTARTVENTNYSKLDATVKAAYNIKRHVWIKTTIKKQISETENGSY